jgi:2-dehydro-3-deoxyphosphogluconate aldolase/(4S)-4-hydroxy-2-oxoglutarate aldolase
MTDLVAKYRAVLTQGFMPICVGDRFAIDVLADCAAGAGARAIEITCRRPDALREIASVKKSHPNLLVLAGSVVDDGPLLSHLQRRRPSMPSLAMLADAGADGFVSALPIRPNSVAAWSPTHLVIPGVETPTEAVQALEHGAHLAKLFTADLTGGPARAARMTSAPTHGLIPLFVTGGITRSRVGDYLDAGVAMLGSGWDVILGERYHALQESPRPAVMAAALEDFLRAFQSHREVVSGDWRTSGTLSDLEFVASRPHYVPPSLICTDGSA